MNVRNRQIYVDAYREPNLAMISLLIFMFAVVAAAVFAISLHQLRGGSA